ncbi:MAG: F0F1 ATP synthase subunit B' [Proteobacteria bacterium]|nr:F0F1 ATP synthase subunit B' [Pseudomonadota bacterium]
MMYRWHRRIAAAVVLPMLALGMAQPAFAEGMPQLDFANPLTTAQVVWGAVIFLALYLLLSRWALPKAADVLKLRSDTIAGDLEAARHAMADADAAVAELTAATAKARAEAQAAVNQATEQARGKAAAQAASLNERLEAQLKEAEGRIEQARAAAMGALHQVASTTASAVVTRLTGQTPDPARLEAAIGAALAARGG